MVASTDDLKSKKVDCCTAGCVAFPAGRANLTACDVCEAPPFRADGKPRMQATYWPLLPWMKMMRADADIGSGMVQTMREAREAAATGSPEDLRDWFDGRVFRKLVAQGYYSSNACIALSISTDCLQA